MIRVAVAGAGRMGNAIAESLGSQPDMSLVGNWGRGGDLDALVRDADVVIDFSLPAAWLGGRWRCVFDTAAPRPFEARAGDPCMAAEPITLADRSLVLVRRVEAG